MTGVYFFLIHFKNKSVFLERSKLINRTKSIFHIAITNKHKPKS